MPDKDGGGNAIDAALPPIPCEPGRFGISGMLEGVRIDPVGVPASVGSSGDGWNVAWFLSPFGVASAWGPGAFGDTADANAIVVAPRSGSFAGGVYEATVNITEWNPIPVRALFSELRRVGRCPGNPLAGELKFYQSNGYGVLSGTLGGTLIEERRLNGAALSSETAHVSFFGEGGVIVIEGTSTGWAGAIVFPASIFSGQVVCIDALVEPPQGREFYATTLTLAGQRPGTRITGELMIEECRE